MQAALRTVIRRPCGLGAIQCDPVLAAAPQQTVKARGGDAVILAVQKQPNADTLKLDRQLDKVLTELQRDLPQDVVIERRIFKQADFIDAAVHNVIEAVRDGALWVIIILFLFMWNFRVSVSSLTAMPLSIFITVLVFWWFGISINTMTMGGIAVAIGDLVDDSIVDIENIYRRLKENEQLVVVEGNRRLAALKALREPGLLEGSMHRQVERLARMIEDPAEIASVPVTVAPSRRATRS